MNWKAHSNQDRLQAREWLNEGFSAQRIAAHFGVNASTISRWARSDRKSGAKHNSADGRPKLTENETQALFRIIDEVEPDTYFHRKRINVREEVCYWGRSASKYRNTWTIDAIAVLVRYKHSESAEAHFCRPTFHRWLKRSGRSYSYHRGYARFRARQKYAS